MSYFPFDMVLNKHAYLVTGVLHVLWIWCLMQYSKH